MDAGVLAKLHLRSHHCVGTCWALSSRASVLGGFRLHVQHSAEAAHFSGRQCCWEEIDIKVPQVVDCSTCWMGHHRTDGIRFGRTTLLLYFSTLQSDASALITLGHAGYAGLIFLMLYVICYFIFYLLIFLCFVWFLVRRQGLSGRLCRLSTFQTGG